MSLSNFPVIPLIYLLFISWNKNETCSPLNLCLRYPYMKMHSPKMFCMSKKNLLLVLLVSNWWMQENCKTNTTFQRKQSDYGNRIYQYTLHTCMMIAIKFWAEKHAIPESEYADEKTEILKKWSEVGRLMCRVRN